MQTGRRLFLTGGIALTAILAIPRVLLAAAGWDKAFASTEAGNAMKELFGGETVTPSSEISLTAPEIAENGAVVPISVETTLANVQSVSVIVENNPRPLAVSFEVPAGTLPNVSCRIKMGQTSPVIALVQTDAGVFSASKEVKVTIGGCGG